MIQSFGQIISRNHLNRTLQKNVIIAKALDIINNYFKTKFNHFNHLPARAIAIRDTTIIIHCQDSIVAQEVRLEEAKLIEMVNNKMGFVLAGSIIYKQKNDPQED